MNKKRRINNQHQNTKSWVNWTTREKRAFLRKSNKAWRKYSIQLRNLRNLIWVSSIASPPTWMTIILHHLSSKEMNRSIRSKKMMRILKCWRTDQYNTLRSGLRKTTWIGQSNTKRQMIFIVTMDYKSMMVQCLNRRIPTSCKQNKFNFRLAKNQKSPTCSMRKYKLT